MIGEGGVIQSARSSANTANRPWNAGFPVMQFVKRKFEDYNIGGLRPKPHRAPAPAEVV